MKENDLHVLTKEEIAQQLYSMEVINDIDFPDKFIRFIVLNEKYDPSNFSQEIEDLSHVDIIKRLKNCNSSLLEYMANKQRNTNEWLDNHSKICKFRISVPLYIKSAKRKNGRCDFCTEDNVNKIIKLSEQCGGIVKIL